MNKRNYRTINFATALTSFQPGELPFCCVKIIVSPVNFVVDVCSGQRLHVLANGTNAMLDCQLAGDPTMLRSRMAERAF